MSKKNYRIEFHATLYATVEANNARDAIAFAKQIIPDDGKMRVAIGDRDNDVAVYAEHDGAAIWEGDDDDHS